MLNKCEKAFESIVLTIIFQLRVVLHIFHYRQLIVSNGLIQCFRTFQLGNKGCVPIMSIKRNHFISIDIKAFRNDGFMIGLYIGVPYNRIGNLKFIVKLSLSAVIVGIGIVLIREIQSCLFRQMLNDVKDSPSQIGLAASVLTIYHGIIHNATLYTFWIERVILCCREVKLKISLKALEI